MIYLDSVPTTENSRKVSTAKYIVFFSILSESLLDILHVSVHCITAQLDNYNYNQLNLCSRNNS